MALAASDFVAGARATAGKQYELRIDLNDGAGYQFLCNTELNEQFNMADETFATLCSEGNMEHEPTNIDYSIPINTILRKSDLTDSLYNIAHDIDALANINVRLDNTLMNVRKEMKAVISISNIGGAAESLVRVEGTIYNRDGKINVTRGIPVLPTSTLSVFDITDTSASFEYEMSVNSGDISKTSLEIFAANDLTTPEITEAPLINGIGTITFDLLLPETTYVAKVMHDGAELAAQIFSTNATVAIV